MTGCNISGMLHYQLLLSPHQVDLFRQGFDICGGFALPAEEVSDVRDIPTLLRIGQGTLEGAPYRADEDLFLLRVPAHPLIQARLACGPVDVRAVMGGVVEVPPFTGLGKVTFKVAGHTRSCELYWMEPSRVVDGSQVIRLSTDGSEHVELTYRGIELGWEDREGSFHVSLPSQFLGSMITRPWGTLPAEVHYVGEEPHHVTMLATSNPEYEEGFIQGENGLWSKEIPYSSSLDVFQLRAMARYRNVPVAVLTAFAQPVPGQAFRKTSTDNSPEGEATEHMVALVSPLIADSLLASQLGFERFTQGMFTATIPLSELTEQSMHEARPHSWAVAGRSLLTEEVSELKDFTKPEGVINEILSLAANVAPEGWKQMRILAQVVGRTVHFAAMARTGDGEELSDPITIPLLPTAIIHLCGQLKRVLARPGEGAPFTLLIAVDENGHVNFSADSHTEPHWADEVPAEVWREELSLFPRDEVPSWLTARLG